MRIRALRATLKARLEMLSDECAATPDRQDLQPRPQIVPASD
jgi:hypothetical protein